MERKQIQKRLEVLQQEFAERQAVRARVAGQLTQLDRELEQRRGGILELELLVKDQDTDDA